MAASALIGRSPACNFGGEVRRKEGPQQRQGGKRGDLGVLAQPSSRIPFTPICNGVKHEPASGRCASPKHICRGSDGGGHGAGLWLVRRQQQQPMCGSMKGSFVVSGRPRQEPGERAGCCALLPVIYNRQQVFHVSTQATASPEASSPDPAGLPKHQGWPLVRSAPKRRTRHHSLSASMLRCTYGGGSRGWLRWVPSPSLCTGIPHCKSLEKERQERI